MSTNEIIGFRAFHHSCGMFLDYDWVTGKNFLTHDEPLPISRSDCHRRIAAFIEQTAEEGNDDFSIDPVFRPLSPIETASAELGSLLQGLCARHGLNLGLTQDQIEAQIAQELQALGATAR